MIINQRQLKRRRVFGDHPTLPFPSGINCVRDGGILFCSADKIRYNLTLSYIPDNELQ